MEKNCCTFCSQENANFHHDSSTLEGIFRGSLYGYVGAATAQRNMQYVCLSRRMLSHPLLFKVVSSLQADFFGMVLKLLRRISLSESHLLPSIHEKKTRTKLTLIAYLGSALCSFPSFRLKPIFTCGDSTQVYKSILSWE